MSNNMDPHSAGMALVNKAFRFLQLQVSEETSVKELDEMYRQVIAFVAEELIERIDRVDYRIKT